MSEKVTVCFILGIMPRSGTNFLENQLRLHPNCKAPGPVWEDFLISELKQLKKFTRNVQRRWDSYWFRNSEIDYSENLNKHLGQSLSNFLVDQLNHDENNSESIVLLTKTPTVKGLEYFELFLGHSKLLIIIRDPRSLIQSGQKSFNWNFEKAVLDWKLNAKKIIKYIKSNDNVNNIIKYEDLIVDQNKTIHKALALLNLEVDAFPIQDLNELPVSGSSELKEEKGEIHWQATKKSDDFKPENRFKDMSLFKQKFIYHFTKKEIKQLGYDFEIKLSITDKILCYLRLFAWPFSAPISTIYYLITKKSFILKTN